MVIVTEFNINSKYRIYYTTINANFHRNLQQNLDKLMCILSIVSSVRNFSFTLLPLSISRSSTCNEQNGIHFSMNKRTNEISNSIMDEWRLCNIKLNIYGKYGTHNSTVSCISHPRYNNYNQKWIKIQEWKWKHNILSKDLFKVSEARKQGCSHLRIRLGCINLNSNHFKNILCKIWTARVVFAMISSNMVVLKLTIVINIFMLKIQDISSLLVISLWSKVSNLNSTFKF